MKKARHSQLSVLAKRPQRISVTKVSRILEDTVADSRAAWYAMSEPRKVSRARSTLRPRAAWGEGTLVSVVVPTFNRHEIFLLRTLPSLLGQSHQNLEVVIVGDRSPKESETAFTQIRDLRCSYRNLRRRTRYPRDPLSRWMVLGTRPMNVGVRSAAGDWLIFVSDDDVLFPNTIADMLKLASDADVDVVLGRSVLSDAMQPSVSKRHPDVVWPGVPSGKVFMVRREFAFFRWNRFSYMKKWNRAADYDLFARMQHAGVRFAKTSWATNVIHPVPGTEGLQGSAAEIALAEEQ